MTNVGTQQAVDTLPQQQVIHLGSQVIHLGSQVIHLGSQVIHLGSQVDRLHWCKHCEQVIHISYLEIRARWETWSRNWCSAINHKEHSYYQRPSLLPAPSTSLQSTDTQTSLRVHNGHTQGHAHILGQFTAAQLPATNRNNCKWWLTEHNKNEQLLSSYRLRSNEAGGMTAGSAWVWKQMVLFLHVVFADISLSMEKSSEVGLIIL